MSRHSHKIPIPYLIKISNVLFKSVIVEIFHVYVHNNNNGSVIFNKRRMCCGSA